MGYLHQIEGNEVNGGYMVAIDHVLFDRTKGGQPITLADAWAELRGCAHCAIFSPTGRLVVSRGMGSFALPDGSPIGTAAVQRQWAARRSLLIRSASVERQEAA